MSFVKNDCQQITFNNALWGLTDRELKMLEKSWAVDFSEKIFPLINEAPFSVLYSGPASRPNTPVNVIIGSLILKELFGLTDDELVETLMFDVRFQYALHTTNFTEQPLSDRSLSRFRARVLQHEEETGEDLLHDCIKELSGEMARIMKINGQMKRMDSLMVEANIKKLSRLELIYTCLSRFITYLHKSKNDEMIEGMEKYYDPSNYNAVVYHRRSEDYDERISTIINDAEVILNRYKNSFFDNEKYMLLERVMREQTVRNEDGSLRLKTKEDGTMTAHILQNPSDPEATYRKKANKEHRGYVANVTESVGDNGSIVTDYQYDQNTKSDSEFLKDYIGNAETPVFRETIIADGAYSGEENKKAANEKNIAIETTATLGKEPNDFNADFCFSDNGEIITCPNGCSPIKSSYNKNTGMCRASFDKSTCANCPFKDQCGSKSKRKVSVVVLSKKGAEAALKNRNDEEWMKTFRSHFRNGVETIPSVLRRKYGIDKMPVRGKLITKLFFGFKIASVNTRKLLNYLSGLRECALNTVFA